MASFKGPGCSRPWCLSFPSLGTWGLKLQRQLILQGSWLLPITHGNPKPFIFRGYNYPYFWGFKFKTLHFFHGLLGSKGMGGSNLMQMYMVNFEGVSPLKVHCLGCFLWWPLFSLVTLQGTDTYPTLGKGNSSWRDLLLEEFRLTHHLGCKKKPYKLWD